MFGGQELGLCIPCCAGYTWDSLSRAFARRHTASTSCTYADAKIHDCETLSSVALQELCGAAGSPDRSATVSRRVGIERVELAKREDRARENPELAAAASGRREGRGSSAPPAGPPCRPAQRRSHPGAT